MAGDLRRRAPQAYRQEWNTDYISSSYTKTVRLWCRHLFIMLVFNDLRSFRVGMTKTNSLWYTDAEFTHPLFTKDMPHSFTIDPGLLQDYIALMDNRIQDLSFLFSSTRVIIKTFWDSSISGQGKLIQRVPIFHSLILLLVASRPMQSQFKISHYDFATYDVNVDTMLTVSMKEFKVRRKSGLMHFAG